MLQRPYDSLRFLDDVLEEAPDGMRAVGLSAAGRDYEGGGVLLEGGLVLFLVKRGRHGALQNEGVYRRIVKEAPAQ